MADSVSASMAGALAPRKVNIVKRQHKYPELCLDVYVSGPDIDTYGFSEMFVQSLCRGVGDPNDADIVVFTGGADVTPSLYNEKEHPSTFSDKYRDRDDINLYNLCYEKGIPMVGVCRGAQFLSVMNGGKLYQDVNKHHGAHLIRTTRDGHILTTSSVHHQMVRPNTSMGMEVLAVAPLSASATSRWLNPTDELPGQMEDVEAFFYRDTLSLGFQGHPEYRGYEEYTAWCLKMIEHYLVNSVDVVLINKQYRLSQYNIDARNEKRKASGFFYPSMFDLCLKEYH